MKQFDTPEILCDRFEVTDIMTDSDIEEPSISVTDFTTDQDEFFDEIYS